jgi:hypothetical protein
VESAFRKISRVGSLSGATKWYLSDDCLLAAKRVLYVVEYKRFYLRDIESIVVWPRRASVWRRLIPGVLVVGLGAIFWSSGSITGAAICGVIGFPWVALELALGRTANARIQTTGASVELPLTKRSRSARKVLAKIDAAIQADRDGLVSQPTTPALVAQLGEHTVPSGSDAGGATNPIENVI